MKQKLILVTDYYPYTQHNESFIENEIPYLASAFDLTVISSSEDVSEIRSYPKEAKIYNCIPITGYSFLRKIKYTLQFFFTLDGWLEIIDIIKSKKLISKKTKSSLYDFFRAQSFYEKVKNLDLIKNDEKILIYTYWSNYKTLAFTHHKTKSMKIITRFHGYDLYNERMGITNRQTFKKVMERKLDGLFFVSQAGMDYYKSHFHKYETPMYLARLGTKKPTNSKNKYRSDSFVIVSCSHVIPIKRVHLIAEALKQINDINIEWHHFGDGSEMENIKSIASLFPKNIKTSLHGQVNNEEVLNFYSNNEVDCFITASSTEGGCPVSIQEAMSYGITVIGTAVGGIPEMLEDTKNIVLKSNPSTEEIVSSIKCIIELKQEGQINTESFTRWKTYYCEEKNNKAFIDLLNCL